MGAASNCHNLQTIALSREQMNPASDAVTGKVKYWESSYR